MDVRVIEDLPTRGWFDACDTAADDVAIIAFTSGTTGEPKGCVHFHRDLLASCDTFARHVLNPQLTDVFSGSPPIAFTFGLGASLLFPLYFGASTAPTSPPRLLDTLRAQRVTTLFTAPTAYRALLKEDLPDSLHTCVSAGEPLPAGVSDAWFEKTGIRIVDGIGSTEMLHIFIASPAHEAQAGSCGRPVPGYEARIVDDAMETLAARRGGQAGGARSDRLPVPRRRAAEQVRARRLEPHRRRVLDGRGRLLLVPGAHGRHDHQLGVQHQRLRGRGRAARAPARRRSAPWSACPTRRADTS